MSSAEFAAKLKSNSSRWLKETFDVGQFQWQEGYGGFSVSPSKQKTVVDYINGQEEHHRRVTYAEEVAWFLENHGLPKNTRVE